MTQETYISKFDQEICTFKGKGKNKKQIDISIYIGDEVNWNGKYYISDLGARFKKEGVENNSEYWKEKIDEL